MPLLRFLLCHALLFAAIGLLPFTTFGQLSMSGSICVQSFDSLAPAGTGIPWTNNVTLPGWYASKSVAPNDVTNYDAGAGASITGSLYSFGAAASSERALGSLASNSRGDFAYGLRLVNDTGFARTNLTVSYTGEQWRRGVTNIQNLIFSYRIGIGLTNADAGNSQAWTPFSALDFTCPNVSGAQEAVNGNATTNRVSLTATLTAVVVPAGAEVFFRWFDTNDPDFDHGLAIDDVTVTFGDALTNTPPPVGSISVVTYNVKGNFTSDWSTNAAQTRAIARQLHYLNPDIVAFNEIPNGLRYEMTNWMTGFFPGYQLAISPGGDTAIRNAVVSRFAIIRSNSWFNDASLTNFGYDGIFTRDLFEAVIAVPGFPQPLHVFVTHLKSGTENSDDASRRGAEARVISNFFANGYLTTNALHPYLLLGDLNEDIAHPATGSQMPIQALTNGTGLLLTTPINPFSLSPLTHSIQGNLDRRYDYILPNPLLYSNIVASQVFRTDLLANPPPPLLPDDDVTASDHLPVQMVFANPYDKPFRLLSLTRSNQTVTLAWESVPGQPYHVERSTNLIAWSVLASNLVASSYATMHTNTVSDDFCFFRVSRQP